MCIDHVSRQCVVLKWSKLGKLGSSVRHVTAKAGRQQMDQDWELQAQNIHYIKLTKIYSKHLRLIHIYMEKSLPLDGLSRAVY